MLISDEVIVINGQYMGENVDIVDFKNTAVELINKSNRKVLNLKFLNFHTFFEGTFITETMGRYVTSLNFENINFMTDTFIDIIIKCHKLKALYLTNIVRWLFFNMPDIIPIYKYNITRMDISLELFPVEIFRSLLLYAPNIDTILFKFYISPIQDPTNMFVTKSNILQFLETTTSLKHLKLGNNCHIFKDLPKTLKLNSLCLSYLNNRRDINQFRILIDEYRMLEKLRVYYLPCCQLLNSIANLINLQELYVTFYSNHMCKFCTNKECLKSFCDSLTALKNLKRLKFLSTDIIDTYESIPSIPEAILKPLQSLDCYMHINRNILYVCQNLTRLRIRNGDFLTIDDYKVLFQNLRNLRDLWIDNCYALTDEVLLDAGISNLKSKYYRNIKYVSLLLN